jgi:methylenetetrahydrofolate reductase (NADPH)
MSEYDIEVIPHLICGGNTKEEIESRLDNLEFLGINNVVALRGDSTVGEKRFTPTPGGYRYASELVEGIRNQHADYFCIGVGGYPEKHFEAANIETDIANLKKKVDAGADYIITQMFFDNKVYYDFVDKCRQAGIEIPIIPGLKPLSTARQVSMLPEAFSLNIPVELTDAIAKAGNDKEAVYKIGTEWCAMQCKDLLAHGVPAVHFYTMGKSRNIVEILRDCF